MHKFVLIFSLVLLFMIGSVRSSRAVSTFYVSSGQTYGNATNVPAAGVDDRSANVNSSGYARGTIQYPFRTIQYAAKQVHAGDTVTVRDGLYSENVYIGQDTNGNQITTQSGASGATIWFAAEHLGLAYVRGSGRYSGCFHIKSDTDHTDIGWANVATPISYIDIRGFDLQSSGHDGTGVTMVWTHNVSVRDCTVHDSGAGGIISKYCDYLYISGNTVSNCCRTSSYNGSGISLLLIRPFNTYNGAGTYHNTITRNTCYNNYIASNATYDTTTTLINHTDGNGIIIDTCSQNISTTVDNNLVYQNGGRGICIDGSFHVDVLNNTCYENNIDPKVGALGEINFQETTWGGVDNSICRYITVRDNICFPMNGKQAFNTDKDAQDLSVTNNWFYVANGGTLIGYNGSTFGANFSVTGNYGVDKTGGNPLFVSPGTSSTASFKLQSGSGCKDKSITHPQYDRDYYARPYNSLWDLGAYEYHP